MNPTGIIDDSKTVEKPLKRYSPVFGSSDSKKGLFKIDHNSRDGNLVHRSFPDEEANGVGT